MRSQLSVLFCLLGVGGVLSIYEHDPNVNVVPKAAGFSGRPNYDGKHFSGYYSGSSIRPHHPQAVSARPEHRYTITHNGGFSKRPHFAGSTVGAPIVKRSPVNVDKRSPVIVDKRSPVIVDKRSPVIVDKRSPVHADKRSPVLGPQAQRPVISSPYRPRDHERTGENGKINKRTIGLPPTVDINGSAVRPSAIKPASWSYQPTQSAGGLPFFNILG